MSLLNLATYSSKCLASSAISYASFSNDSLHSFLSSVVSNASIISRILIFSVLWYHGFSYQQPAGCR